jgi:hemerythrin
MAEEFVSWSDNLSIGIGVIDEQHRELLRLTNDLYRGCSRIGEERDLYFKDAIHRSVDYVKIHFSTEESLLEKVNYPDIEAHKKEHRDFIIKVLENVRDFEDGKRFAPSAFVRFLRDWILTHIAVSDKNYGPYLLNSGKINN